MKYNKKNDEEQKPKQNVEKYTTKWRVSSKRSKIESGVLAVSPLRIRDHNRYEILYSPLTLKSYLDIRIYFY